MFSLYILKVLLSTHNMLPTANTGFSITVLSYREDYIKLSNLAEAPLYIAAIDNLHMIQLQLKTFYSEH